ncbi:MAG: DUF4397 domain-containing protein [Pedobacter sp.]|nr:MAG: DUF4397 domain-containing protein [Pedobacter sp.]
MKIANNFKSISKAFIAILTLSVALVACKKDDPQPQQISGLKVINAFADTLSLDFVVDQTIINSNPFKYNVKSSYLNLYPGTRTIGIAKRKANKFLASQTFSLAQGKGYSFFVLDTLSTNTKKFLLIEDDLSDPAADKAKVRFINLSKDAPALNLGIEGKDTDLFTNKAFYEYTTFSSVDPGESVTFNIKENTTVKATVPNVKIEKGKIYTIYAKGLKDATIDSLKFRGDIYTH